jgi:hypothetical protein
MFKEKNSYSQFNCKESFFQLIEDKKIGWIQRTQVISHIHPKGNRDGGGGF